MKTRMIVVVAAGMLAGVGATWAGREAQGPNSNGSNQQGSNMQGSNIQGSNVQGAYTNGNRPRQRATGLKLESLHVVGGHLVPGKR